MGGNVNTTTYDQRAAARRAGTALAAAAIFAAFAAAPAQAAPLTWDGQIDFDWNTAANWDPDTAPSVTSDVIIDNGALANLPFLQAGDASTVNTVSVSGGSLLVEGSLTALSGVSVAGTGILQIGSGGEVIGDVMVSGSGQLTGAGFGAGVITGDLSLTGGTLEFLFGASPLTVTGDLTGSGFALRFANIGAYTPGLGLSFEFLVLGEDALSEVLAATISFIGFPDASLLSVFVSADGRRFSLAERNPYADGAAEVPIPGALLLFLSGAGALSFASARRGGRKAHGAA